MSIFASILRSAYRISGAKKAFALPEDALRKEIEKQNRHRGVFTPTDRKAYYETITVNGFPCLIVREHLILLLAYPSIVQLSLAEVLGLIRD